MRCPYCQTLLQASAVECTACRLSYPRTCTLLGAVPRLAPLLADTTHTLHSAEHARIKRRITAIQRRFPQLVPQVVMHAFPAQHPFSMHVFWLFNAVDLAGSSHRGSANHSLMLAIDPDRGEAAIIPGYGLETFLTEDMLQLLLDLAAPPWAENRWTDGIIRVLDGLDAMLETVAVSEPPGVGEGDY